MVFRQAGPPECGPLTLPSAAVSVTFPVISEFRKILTLTHPFCRIFLQNLPGIRFFTWPAWFNMWPWRNVFFCALHPAVKTGMRGAASSAVIGHSVIYSWGSGWTEANDTRNDPPDGWSEMQMYAGCLRQHREPWVLISINLGWRHSATWLIF